MAINSNDEYKSCLSIIDSLWDKDLVEGTEDFELFNKLASLIEEYEHKHYPIPPPDPIE